MSGQVPVLASRCPHERPALGGRAGGPNGRRAPLLPRLGRGHERVVGPGGPHPAQGLHPLEERLSIGWRPGRGALRPRRAASVDVTPEPQLSLGARLPCTIGAMSAGPVAPNDPIAGVVAEARALPLAQARARFAAVREALHAAGDAAGAAEVLLEEARLLASTHDRRRLHEALRALEEADRAIERLGRPARLEGIRLHVAGYAAFRGGRLRRAGHDLRRAEAVFRRASDPVGEARVLDTLGMVCEREGSPVEALLYLTRALRLKQTHRDRDGEAISLGNLGRLALHQGQPAQALEYLEMDLALARALDDVRGQSVVLGNLTEAFVALGRISEASDAAAESRALGERVDDAVTTGFGHLAEADVARARGDLDAALRSADVARATFEIASSAAGTAHACLVRADVLRRLGRPVEALRDAVAALRAARSGGALDVAVQAALEAQAVAALAGDRRRARRLIAHAERLALRSPTRDALGVVQRRQAADALVSAASGERLLFRPERTRPASGIPEAGEQVLRVVRFLGRGEFASVFAVEREPDGRPFALKRFHQRPDRGASLEGRMRREFTAVARVPTDAPLIHVHAFGHLDGRPALLLDLVPFGVVGGALDALCERVGTLPWEVAARIGADVARGLAALHAVGVVHRDVKPSNVLVDETGHARLTDFGLVYDVWEETYVADGNSFKGALAYIAPEHCADLDDWAEPTPACDLYSLGILLHEVLTGTFPFPTRGVAPHEVLTWKLSRDIDDRALVGVPASLVAVIRALCARDPSRRPSAADAATALDRCAEELTRD